MSQPAKRTDRETRSAPRQLLERLLLGALADDRRGAARGTGGAGAASPRRACARPSPTRAGPRTARSGPSSPCEPARRGDLVGVGGPLGEVDAVGQHVDLVDRQLEQPGHLPPHVLRAGDHAAGLVGQPPLDRVDRRAEVVGQPALVPAGLGGVHGGDDRHLERRAQVGRGVRHQPVVGVNHLGAPGAAEAERGAGDRVVERHRPGQEALVRRHLGVVVRHTHHAHAVHDLVVRQALGARVRRDHRDVVAGRGLRLGQGVHVPTQAAVDQRRVLPRQMQHTHGRQGTSRPGRLRDPVAAQEAVDPGVGDDAVDDAVLALRALEDEAELLQHPRRRRVARVDLGLHAVEVERGVRPRQQGIRCLGRVPVPPRRLGEAVAHRRAAEGRVPVVQRAPAEEDAVSGAIDGEAYARALLGHRAAGGEEAVGARRVGPGWGVPVAQDPCVALQRVDRLAVGVGERAQAQAVRAQRRRRQRHASHRAVHPRSTGSGNRRQRLGESRRASRLPKGPSTSCNVAAYSCAARRSPRSTRSARRRASAWWRACRSRA